MIIKLGIDNGFEYIETKGSVVVKKYNPIELFKAIQLRLEKEKYEYETDADLVNHVKNLIYVRQEKDKKYSDNDCTSVEEIEKQTMLGVTGEIYSTVTTSIISKEINLEEMICHIAKGYGYHSNFVVLEFQNEEFAGETQAILMYNKNTTYLLNDEGKTIDIIK